MHGLPDVSRLRVKGLVGKSAPGCTFKTPFSFVAGDFQQR